MAPQAHSAGYWREHCSLQLFCSQLKALGMKTLLLTYLPADMSVSELHKTHSHPRALPPLPSQQRSPEAPSCSCHSLTLRLGVTLGSPPTFSSNNRLRCLCLWQAWGADSAVWAAPSRRQLLPVCSREAVVSQMKASHRSQAEPRSPRSIPRALALNLRTKLLKELTSHSPTAGFATSTHWGQPHLVLSFPVPLAHTRGC